MKNSSKSGLTLVELLIAAVLTSVVMLTAATILVSVFQENTRQSAMMTRQAEISGAMELLREKVLDSRIPDLASLSGGGLEAKVNGVTFSFRKVNNTLVFKKGNGAPMDLIQGGVQNFNAVEITNRVKISASFLLHDSATEPVVYEMEVAPRNN
jgi:Tfp pilus assembly protein PilV